MDNQRRASEGYRPEIDGLRALAIAMVVLGHAGMGAFEGGFVGVDMFFVISGFLITLNLARRPIASRDRLLDFYEHRIRRIVPALFATIVLTLLVGFVLLLPSELELFAREARATGLFVPNVFLWKQTSYFGPDNLSHLLLHCWSLGVEEQFYLLFPLPFLIVAARTKRLGLLLMLALAWIASLLLSAAFVRSYQAASFYLLPTRLWELLTGAILALLPAYRGRWGTLMASGGITAVLGAALTYRVSMLFPGPSALIPVAGTALVLAVGRENAAFRLLSIRPVRAIGIISYSLYLVHWPVLLLMMMCVGRQGMSTPVVALYLAVSVGLAAVMWRYVEQPVRRWQSGRRTWALLAAFIAFSLLVPQLILAFNGFPGRFSHDAETMLAREAATARTHQASYRCSATPLAKDFGPCPLGLAKPTPDVVIISDSHGAVLRQPLSQALAKAGKSGVILASSGCAPVHGLKRLGDGRSCLAHGELAYRYVLKARPQAVLLIGAWRSILYRLETESDGKVARTDEARLGHVATALTRTIAAYHAAGIRVGVTLPVPGAREHVPQALARDMPIRIEWTGAEHRAAFDGLSRAVAAAMPDAVADLSIPYCRQSCQVVDGQPLYFDNHHLNPFGAKRLQPTLDKLVLDLAAPAG